MNQMKCSKFTSVFKVDGKPILPPLITSEKRKLIQQYRKEAILIENNLKSRKSPLETKNSFTEQCATDSENLDNDDVKLSNFPKSPNKNIIQNRPICDLQKSDTLIYDVISNTVIIPYESENSELFSELNEMVKQSQNCKKEEIRSPKLKKCVPLPSVVVKPPTPEILFTPSKPNEILETDNSLSENSLLDNVEPINTIPSLIRTNSFVLEKASTALLEHMDKFGLNESQDIPLNQNIINKKRNISSASHSKSPKIVGYKRKVCQNFSEKSDFGLESTFSNASLFKNKKSPYDTRKNKTAKKHKCPILKTSSNITLKTKSFNNSIHKTRVNDNENTYINQAIEDIEKQHKIELMELTKKHQDEQQKMQEAFECKQKFLMDYLTSQTNLSKLDDQNTEIDQREKSCEKIKNLKYNIKNNIKIDGKTVLKESFNVTPNSSSERREKAATIINKYVRGYLTRRMLKTNYVQKVVKTIQDTLLYVINLHKYTKFNDDPENMRTKIRLLNQLQSSCYNLHDVFFELSTKQRMTLISKDRMYKNKNKLCEKNQK